MLSKAPLFSSLSVLFAIFLSNLGFAATGKPLAEIVANERWSMLKEQLFGNEPIDDSGGVIMLQMPGRAFDGARVPLTVRAMTPQSSDNYIEKLHLIVDNNPLPVAGTFTFEPNQGWDTLDTEIRLNEYSSTRVVAQLSDGSLHMDSRFVKASGGCSAPPSSYERSDANLLGKFSAEVSPLLNPELPTAARIRLVHPNASGMQFDQYTRTYIPPHYIHTMVAQFNGKRVFKLETNFSLSQDPVLGFNFTPKEDGELMIYALDSEGERFEQSWLIAGSNANN